MIKSETVIRRAKLNLLLDCYAAEVLFAPVIFVNKISVTDVHCMRGEQKFAKGHKRVDHLNKSD